MSPSYPQQCWFESEHEDLNVEKHQTDFTSKVTRQQQQQFTDCNLTPTLSFSSSCSHVSK